MYSFRVEQINCGKRKRELGLLQLQKDYAWLSQIGDIDTTQLSREILSQKTAEEVQRMQELQSKLALEESNIRREYTQYVQEWKGKGAEEGIRFTNTQDDKDQEISLGADMRLQRVDGPAKEDKGSFDKNSKAMTKP